MLRDLKNQLLPQIAIAVGVVVIIGLAIIFLGIYIRNAAADTVSIKTEMSIRARQLGDILRLREEAKLAEPGLISLQNALPQKDELISLPEQIAGLAAANNASATFKFGNEATDNIEFSMVVEGGYGSIVNFIHAIENQVFFINISTVNIVNVSGGAYRADIKGRVFFGNGQ